MRSSFDHPSVADHAPQILTVIDAIYAAAMDVTRWPAALRGVARLTNCSAVYLAIDAAGAPADEPSDALRFAPLIWVGDASAISATDSADVDGDARPAFCTEIYRNDCVRAVLAGRGVIDASDAAVMAIVQCLLPHFARAVEIIAQSDDLGRRQATAAASLDRFSQPIVVVDANRQVWFANRAAARLLKRRDGLTVTDGVLCATTTRGRDALTRLGHDSEPVPDVTCRSIFVDRVSPKPPLHIFAIELAGHEHGRSAHDQQFALFISDPEGGGALEEQTLGELFHLTPTEARIAAALADGMTLAEVARQLGLAVATARWHLRHVFAKTHTCRQPEVVNLLLRSLSAMDGE